MKALTYPKANRTAQNFSDNYPGVHVNSLYRLVIHTTEGGGWPAYSGGALAPTLTALPDYANERLIWRQHFDMDESARAVENRAGGVLTNTSGIVQIELVGTCVKGGPGMYWPEAPDWALRDLAEFILWLDREWSVPAVTSVKWVAYPASYGQTASRLTGAEWNAYRGFLGHQHVPENDHGDPGLLPVARLRNFITPTDWFDMADKNDLKAALTEVLRDNPGLVGAAVHNQKLYRMTRADGQPYTIADAVIDASKADDPVLRALAENQITMQKAQAEIQSKLDSLAETLAKLVPTQPTN